MDAEMELDIVQSNSKDGNPKDLGPAVNPSLLCGLGSWRPSWIQWLANHNAYSAAFILIGIIQGMSYTYFNGIVTTVEKAFHVDSNTMGIVVAGNDISQIMFGMLFTYVANRGNRPFWMATGILIGALACFVYASTQLFWDGGGRADDLQIAGRNNYSGYSPSAMMGLAQMCDTTMSATNKGNYSYGHDVVCSERAESGRSADGMMAAIWLFLGQFVSGIGGTTTYSIGLTYMDDNIKKHNTPLYIGLTAAMRSLGPTLGYMMASLCLKVYINPYDVPEYESRDPRWLGAWWLGFIVIGILQTLFAIPLLAFPRVLPSSPSSLEKKTKATSKDAAVVKFTLRDFGLTFKRLAKNPILVLKITSFCFMILPVVGVSTFLPKYLEARFGQTASQANVLTGLAGNMMAMLGVMTGGIVIWKFKPRTMFITGWITFIEAVHLLGFVVLMHLDCNDIAFEGVRFQDGRAEITSDCRKACDCELTFDPVCVGGQNFLSPCLAGCSAIFIDVDTGGGILNLTKNIFYNCSCAAGSVGHSGFCEDIQEAASTCSNLWVYVIVIASIKLIVSSARTGSLLVTMRCVLKEDKAVAISLIAVAGSIFGFIPGPIIYGAAVDSACLLWETTSCGRKGNCWFYDVQVFSYWFHGLIIFFGVITVILNAVITVISRHLRLYDEDDPDADPDCDN